MTRVHRLQMDTDAHPPVIRATQGHSVQLAAPILTRITSAEAVPQALHVTSQDAWKTIQADGFLRRMNRTHIHFATKPALARKNSWANCFLRLKVAAALAAGIELRQSSNGVVLCEGPLDVAFVEEVAGF